ncbi:MAG: hypothetical protein COT84_02920 [Chlamydiae bacterium CG10_big_fil_rev_8_21_14_0_10_35_9]|nr:MAG: hypothetical protein COT84_02920 [Chlamydiae bacterium CG10_big_fil_rev_8_21_14_0_10_35_9]
MNTEISLDTKLWAHKNFSGLSLGDSRRSRRVIDIAQKMAQLIGLSRPLLSAFL